MSRYLTDEELDAIRKRAPMYAGGDYVSLLAEVERLRYSLDIERANSLAMQARVAMLDSHRANVLTTLERGYEEGTADERAAVVAWLREHWSEVLEQTPQQTAKLIERGEHRREEER